jgi:uncharacterized repeat protein (TIGR01451 family)
VLFNIEDISVNKRISLIGLGAVAAIALVPMAGHASILSQAVDAGKSAIANVLNRPSVSLHLVADKKMAQKDAQGNKTVAWKALANGASVSTGDVVRFTVTGANQGDRPAKNLTVVQPIATGFSYVANSATAKGAKSEVAFSIDNGKTFSAQPTVAVKLANGQVESKPAPVSAYSQVRWTFTEAVAPKAQTVTSYQVAAR